MTLTNFLSVCKSTDGKQDGKSSTSSTILQADKMEKCFCLPIWFGSSRKVSPITSMSSSELYNFTICQYITELIKCLLFLSRNLGRSQMSLSNLGTEVNQIKLDWAYQSSGLFEGPCWLPEHMSSFIFSQSTWWINSQTECLAPILHLHKSNFRWNIQSSPLPQDILQALCWEWNYHLHSVLSKGNRLCLTSHIHIYSVKLNAQHQENVRCYIDTFLMFLTVSQTRSHLWYCVVCSSNGCKHAVIRFNSCQVKPDEV